MTQISEQQHNLWLDRYALKGKNGEPVEKSIDETFDRVANAIGDTEDERHEFRRILEDFHFVPGGRILAGAGAGTQQTFYNCYVIPVEAAPDVRVSPDYRGGKSYPGNDSREAIFETRKRMVDIMSRGGGVGINWSVLRPSGSYLARISGTSSGPLGWMDAASVDVGTVIQGGSRRGAAMFMLDDWHPNVIDFINVKRDNSLIQNANISVAVSDEFMKAVEDDEDWDLVFPETSHEDYDQHWNGDIKAWREAGRPVRTFSTHKARSIWNAIAESAWASGEPGVVFLGRYNAQSTGASVERLISVNPCGEQGLGPYSVCNLGSMNLYSYVDDGGFRWNDFETDVGIAVRFLDNVIDKSHYFIPETQRQQMLLRRIGLGVMGLADALVALGIRYGSEESVKFVDDVFGGMKVISIITSNQIAVEKGAARGWNDSMWDRPFLKGMEGLSAIQPDAGMRNLFLLTQAPTGTTALLAGVNSGIEPYFNLKTWRDDRTGGRWVYARAVADVLGDVEHPLNYDYVITAEQVPVEEHIAVQVAVQRNIDSSVSKTINAPKEQTVEETRRVFDLAWKSDLKGLAYYRDGSRNVQVLYHNNPNEVIAELEAKVKELTAKLAFKERATPDFSGVTGFESNVWPNFPITMMPTFGQDVCPACGVGAVIHVEGCQQCVGAEGHAPCGWSAC
jgi:ribonucleoside-diphosphate reductase alpha chain